MIPSPAELGFPAKYQTWRRFQEDAIITIDSSVKPVVALMLPPGAGKSAIYFAWAVWRKKRVMVLTPSKFLQDQLYADFKGIGLLDLRGQSNYKCEVTQGTVQDAPCHGGYVCPIKGSCEYFAKLARAPKEQFLVSNPSFWLHNKHVLGDFDALVMDEGHQMFDAIATHVSVTFKKREVEEHFHQKPQRDWKSWASYQRSLFKDQLRTLKGRRQTEEVFEQTRIIRRLYDKVGSLCDADPASLIYQQHLHGWTWDCVWPGNYRSRLTSNAKKYVFTSGTMTRRTLAMLGYAKEDYTWAEFPSTFPVKRCPVHVLPAPRLNYQTGASELRLWLELIDKYIDSRSDRRGLIHSGSYERSSYFALNSRHRDRMFIHMNSAGLPEAKERFLASPNGILVSPAIIEGGDFPYEAARYQIIAKLFFTNPNDPVEAERKRQDPAYPWYAAAMKVMQARGRVMRVEDDFGETAICDGAWQEWFARAASPHFTRYFLDAVQVLDVVPSALPIPTDRRVKETTTKPASILKKKLDVDIALAPQSASLSSLFAATPSKKSNIRRK